MRGILVRWLINTVALLASSQYHQGDRGQRRMGRLGGRRGVGHCERFYPAGLDLADFAL